MDKMMKVFVLLREASQMSVKSMSDYEQVLALLSQAEALLPLGVSVLWSIEHECYAVFPLDPEEYPDTDKDIYRQQNSDTLIPAEYRSE